MNIFVYWLGKTRLKQITMNPTRKYRLAQSEFGHLKRKHVMCKLTVVRLVNNRSTGLRLIAFYAKNKYKKNCISKLLIFKTKIVKAPLIWHNFHLWRKYNVLWSSFKFIGNIDYQQICSHDLYNFLPVLWKEELF